MTYESFNVLMTTCSLRPMGSDRYNTRREGYSKNNDEFKYAFRKINTKESIMRDRSKELKMVPTRDLPLSTAIFGLCTSMGSDSTPCKNLQL